MLLKSGCKLQEEKNGPAMPQCVSDVVEICNRFDAYGLENSFLNDH